MLQKDWMQSLFVNLTDYVSKGEAAAKMKKNLERIL